ncbi:MAG: PqqD family protein [Lachnospiraceae bacterium]|nr:PqqD family protein [Lachnospiraceae bacterium]
MVRKVAGMYYIFNDHKDCDLGEPVVLNEMGYFIYQKLKEKKTPEKIATEISSNYAVDFEEVLKDVLDYATMLENKKLLDA